MHLNSIEIINDDKANILEILFALFLSFLTFKNIIVNLILYKTKFQHSIIVCMFCFLCLPIVHMINFCYKFSFTCVKKKPKTHSCGQFRTFFGRMNGILHDDADILFCFFRHWKISSMYSSFQVIKYW